METSDLKLKSSEELRDMASAMKAKLQSFGFDLHAGKVKNVREIREMRKDIARILTVLRQQSVTK
ncbi:MAG: 50S ribosomal protein L29 [bacterium]|nr:50S ribosomal protein L29 [bacterium]